MNKKNWLKIGVLLLVLAAGFAVFWQARSTRAGSWQRQVLPGKLAAAHAPLETNCAACHTPVTGIDEAKCIACHANNENLLQRQPTAFHANIGNCAACHVEHQGLNANLRVMNHQALARIGGNLIAAGVSVSNQADNPVLPENHPLVTPLEAKLDCAGCHRTKDKHFGLFAQNCAACHATTEWTIPAFQHPSPRSTDCAQCHQAPPSHYMMHFEMVDKKIVGQAKAPGNPCCEGVQVTQCYVCHQTTSWNDIRGIGFYKLH